MIYLDASVVVAALSQEPHSAAVRAWLGEQQTSRLAVSLWTRVEVASALAVKARRKDITIEQQKRALVVMDNLANGLMNWVLVTPIAEDFEIAEHLAGQTKLNLRGADALHVAIAYRNDWALATLDKDMRIAAARTGVVLDASL